MSSREKRRETAAVAALAVLSAVLVIQFVSLARVAVSAGAFDAAAPSLLLSLTIAAGSAAVLLVGRTAVFARRLARAARR